jgi:PAS domain S-box-containing protein
MPRPRDETVVTWTVRVGAVVPILLGAFWLTSWFSGRADTWGRSGVITMKTNMAAAQVLMGSALALLSAQGFTPLRRWLGCLAAAAVLLTGALTLSEYVTGRDLGIDQLLAEESPGAPATVSPNRMGIFGAVGLVLGGSGLLALGLGARRLAAACALTVSVVVLVPAVGYLYGIRELYSRPGLTGIAWTTVAALLSLASGMMLTSSRGPVSLLLAKDAGGVLFRQYLPVVLGFPLLLGFLTSHGLHRGLYDANFGAGLLVILLILVLGGLLWRSAARLSRSAAAEARSQAELRQQQEWLRVTLRSIGDAVITCDTAGNITFLNSVAESLTGWSRQDALGQPSAQVFRVVNERTGQPTLDPVAKVLRDQKTVALDNHAVLVARDGGRVPIEDSAAPILDDDRVLRGVVLVFNDVTEKRHGEQLVESTALFPQENPCPVLRIDAEGLLLYANPASSELLAQWNSGLGRVLPPDIRSIASRALETQQRQEVEEECAGRELSLMVTPVPGRRYVNLYGRDLTEQNRAQRALAEAKASLEQERDLLRAAKGELAHANQALERKVEERTLQLRETIADLEQFSYSIAHDLRAPLRSMSSFSSILIEEYARRLDEDGVEYLRRIASAARRMDDLIRDVLTYSRIVRSDSSLGPVDLDHLVRDIVDQYPQFSKDRVEIAVERPLAPVAANSALLTQCISNLLGNAAKFVLSGVKPKVRIWSEQHDGEVRLLVRDNGIGIDASQLDRIWRIFERAHDPKQYEGTGIGLSIVKRAVERMGGTVGVESTPQGGSTFWIQLSRP